MRTGSSIALALLLPLLWGAANYAPVTDGDDAPVAGLKGSKHDFSGQAWTGGSLCVACHAGPHDDAEPVVPEWSPSVDFNRRFADALAARESGRSMPGAGTLVCMRCHDGSVAADMFGGLAAPSSPNVHHPSLRSTGHGGTNHPVGIDYPQIDSEYTPVHAIESEGAVVLPDARVECISCHDPHNELGLPYMLVKSNERSALCLTCHRK